MTRRGLRILCYHGTSLDAEHKFLPVLFMSPETFEARLNYIQQNHFPVLPLGKAVELLQSGNLPDHATVITIDDGFFGTYERAWPILTRLNLPATLYVTSYYVANNNPMFGLTVEYLFWKTTRTEVDLSGIELPVTGLIPLGDLALRSQVVQQIVDYGETQCDENTRCAVARELARRLAVDYDELARTRIMSLITPAELRKLAHEGLDIQLHTHRHRFPEDERLALRELADNRSVLESNVGGHLEHFCYPSGIWSERHWPWLRTAGVKTATTCLRGLNYTETPVLALRRFLDGEHFMQIEFEAEMCGYTEILRRCRSAVRQVLSRTAA